VPRRLEAILLAAGESRRMGYPKPLLKIEGRTFIEHIIRQVEPFVTRIVIVVGAHSERVRAAIPKGPTISVVENPNYAQGQLSSLKIGIANLSAAVSGALVHLGDHPLVSAETIRRLSERYQSSSRPIVIARYRGRRGHPVIFDRALFNELMSAPLERGARAVVEADPSRVDYVDVEDAGVTADLDTLADLERAGLPPPAGRA
jgi:molybdenum cofactor cytidylyltransferase